MTVSDRAVAIWIAVIAAAIYVATGIGLATDYDYSGRLADAFLHGRWWLTEAPPWLNELLLCGEGRFCVVYPPLAAILSLPFVPFFPTAVSQVVASRLAGGASAGILYFGLRAYGAPRTYALAGATHPRRPVLQPRALPPPVPRAPAQSDLSRAARSHPGHAVLFSPTLHRHEPLSDHSRVPLDLSGVP